MRAIIKALLLLLVAYAALPQQSNYPGAVDTDRSLFVVADNVQTSLSQQMSTSDTKATVASATGFAINMIATICDTQTNTGKCTAWEHMLVTAISGNQLTVTRAFAGTSARTHASGKLVTVLIDAAHQQALKSAVIGIETALGPNLTNATSVINTKSYNFSAQSPGGSLIAGNNSITMTPVPAGVNGTDQNHYLYVSGGTGTPEPCLITGGSGTAGQASGQIILNCTGSHTGAWTLTSATAGITEAMITAGNGLIYVPPGTYNVYAAIQIPTMTTLSGSGQGSTTIFAPNGALTQTRQWQMPGVATDYCMLCMAPNGNSQTVQDLTVDANGASNPYFYYAHVEGREASNGTVQRVTLKNHAIQGGTSVSAVWSGSTANNTNNVFSQVSVIGLPTCTVPNGGGAFYVTGYGNRIISSYATNYCDSPFVLADCDHCGIYNSVADLGGGQMGTPAFSIEGATNSVVSGNHCMARGTNAHYICYQVQNANINSSGNILTGNSASRGNIGVVIGPGTATPMANNTNQVTDTIVTGFHADGMSGNCFSVNMYVGKLNISNSDCFNISNVGIAITSEGLTGTKVVNNVIIDGVTIDHAKYGLQTVNNTTGPPVNTLTVTDSFLGDTSTSPTSLFGIYVGPGTVQLILTHNRLLGNTTGPWTFQNSFATGSVIFPNTLPTDATMGLIPGCTSGLLGNQVRVSDAATNVWGAVVSQAGGGTNAVQVGCITGTGWTVVGK